MSWPKGKPWTEEMRAARARKYRPLDERYRKNVDVRGPDECWPWKGKLRKSGYGWISVGHGKIESAHRVAWMLHHNELPDKFHVDHDCHNRDEKCAGGPCAHRSCQNPAHLRLVTHGANVLDGKGVSAVNARKTHCNNGHEFTATNTYVRPGGKRTCRACHAEAQLRYSERKASSADGAAGGA